MPAGASHTHLRKRSLGCVERKTRKSDKLFPYPPYSKIKVECSPNCKRSGYKIPFRRTDDKTKPLNESNDEFCSSLERLEFLLDSVIHHGETIPGTSQSDPPLLGTIHQYSIWWGRKDSRE